MLSVIDKQSFFASRCKQT